MFNDAFISRIKSKARSNQLVIAFGNRFSHQASLPRIAKGLRELHKDIPVGYEHELEYFSKWNEFVAAAESKTSRRELVEYVLHCVRPIKIAPVHRKVAAIPISNFIDTTLDRRLVPAMKESGKVPIVHDFRSGRMGSWKQSNQGNPNVFYAFGNLESPPGWFGLQQQISLNPQNRIQLENMIEMVRQKDLLLLGFSPHEAEHLLHLGSLSASADRIVNTEDETNDYHYWSKRGTYLAEVQTETVIDHLLPFDRKSYSLFDAPFPRTMLVDISKEKLHDAFVSHFSGDKPFATRLSGQLSNRELNVWVDEFQIDIGDSISDKIQEALKNSYTFIIVLSPEALERPWVKEELRAAYNLRLADELKILPVVYKECELPLFLADYRYADFRDEKRFDEQMEILSRSVKNAVMRARGKIN